jgi:hypothetical protein
MFSLVMLLIGSGLALLWANEHAGHGQAQAADVSVVGPPTLAASTIDGIFTRLGSPMRGLGTLIEQMSRQDNIDDAFALGVWWTETNDGEAGVGLADRNPGSVRGSVGYPSAWDGYTIYPSYADAVVYWFNMLRTRYVDEGLSTVYVIARPYVGTSSYPLWAAKVINLMYEYRGLAPPPPINTPTPKPTVNPFVLASRSAWRGRQAAEAQWFAQHNTAPLAYQGLSQERVRPTSAPLLSPAQVMDGALVALGLLLALLMALLALKVGKMSVSQRARVAVAPAAQTNTVVPAMNVLSLPAYSPVALPSTPMPRLPAYGGASGPPRRVTLRPAPSFTSEPTPVLVGASGRPNGLLSRYGQSGAGSPM